MKKIITFILTLILALGATLGLASCDEEGKRTLLGLTFELTDDFEERTYSGYTYSFSNGEAEFLIAAMSYQQLEESTYDNMPDPWPTNVYDYSRHFVIVNGIGLSHWEYDEEENVAMVKHVFEYTGEDAMYMEDEYVHYVMMDNGEAIYFITYSCKIDYRDKYEPLFNKWASELELEKVR